jgi:prepilin-type N-terminal cleavage/methylation domain-containing protein
MKRSGFTLIELLIVVAIIAILAAIAVPNFLEAQVRSKVSRVKSDMRTLATAIEAYRVDYTGYMPYSVWGQHTDPRYLNALTTPVAYVTSISAMRDPFWAPGDMTYDRTVPRYGYIRTWPVLANGTAPAAHACFLGALAQGCAPVSAQWGLVSPGPDKFQDADTQPSGGPGVFRIYDATNGTRSMGDIWRFGP